MLQSTILCVAANALFIVVQSTQHTIIDTSNLSSAHKQKKHIEKNIFNIHYTSLAPGMESNVTGCIYVYSRVVSNGAHITCKCDQRDHKLLFFCAAAQNKGTSTITQENIWKRNLEQFFFSGPFYFYTMCNKSFFSCIALEKLTKTRLKMHSK